MNCAATNIRRAIAAIMAALLLLAPAAAFALEDQRLVGVVAKFDIASDGKSAQVKVKDTRKDKEVVLFVTNDLIIDKLKYGKMVAGDEVRAKYESKDGKNFCTYLRKVAGE